MNVAAEVAVILAVVGVIVPVVIVMIADDNPAICIAVVKAIVADFYGVAVTMKLPFSCQGSGGEYPTQTQRGHS